MKITGFYATRSKPRQTALHVGTAAYVAAKITLTGKM